MDHQSRWAIKLKKALRDGQSRPGVVGVDYGFVYKAGERLKTLGIRFHVNEKLPVSALPPEHVLPKKIDAVRCDVVRARYGLAASPRAVCDPVQIGVSLGNIEHTSTGTLGLIARDNHTSGIALVSNWHVLCGSTSAKVGDRISQPGPLHLGSQPPRIAGRLERWLDLNVGIDAAIALIHNRVHWKDEVFGPPMSIAGTQAATIGMHLVKYGAVSGLTHGYVDGIAGSYRLDYSTYGDTTRWMDGIRLVEDPDHPEAEISLAGDSGALWFDAASGHAVALHFAGEDGLGPTSEYALAYPIARVMDLLDVSLP